MAYEYFYKGNPYSLEPTYGDRFIGQGVKDPYRISAGELGATTSIQTANQVKEVTNLLNQGIKKIEVSTIQPEIFDAIPKQHFKEINRLQKLTGSNASVHAPLFEASGYSREGTWDETSRKISENQIWSAVEKSHEIDPKGNVPVTFHASAMLPLTEEKIKTADGEKVKSFYFVDSSTGKIGKIEDNEKFFAGEVDKNGKQKPFSMEDELKRRNEETWIKAVNDLNYYASRGTEAINSALKIPEKIYESQDLTEEEKERKEKQLLRAVNELKPDDLDPELREGYKEISRTVNHGKIFLQDSYNNLKQLYNLVYKDAAPDDKKKLNEYREEITPLVEAKVPINNNPEKLKEFAEVIEKGLKILNEVKPKLYKPLNEFLIDKTSETFGNVAFQSYERFKGNAPIISIENPPIDNALSRAEDLKNLIQKSRGVVVDRLVKENHMKKEEAEKVASNLIGATWDTSHIAMMRKYGFTNEDLKKEAKTIAPFVKHVHYNDNFGSAHTDLPPGMGDVPMHDIMKTLKDAGFKGAKIFEGGGFFQNFQTSPHPYVLEGSGSPLYNMKAPYWNQAVATMGNYFSFPSAYFPDQHFSLYGGGFSSLPVELGGQMQGKSRVSGTNID